MNVLERNKVKLLELQTSWRMPGTHIWEKGENQTVGRRGIEEEIEQIREREGWKGGA